MATLTAYTSERARRMGIGDWMGKGDDDEVRAEDVAVEAVDTEGQPLVDADAPVVDLPLAPGTAAEFAEPVAEAPLPEVDESAYAADAEPLDEAPADADAEPAARVMIDGHPAPWVDAVETGPRHVALITDDATEANRALRAQVFVVDGLVLDRDMVAARSYGAGRLTLTLRAELDA